MDASTYTPNPRLSIHTRTQILSFLGYTGPRIIIGHQSEPGYTSPALGQTSPANNIASSVVTPLILCRETLSFTPWVFGALVP